MKTPKVPVRITNVGRPAFAIGPTGAEVGEPIPTGGFILREWYPQSPAQRHLTMGTK